MKNRKQAGLAATLLIFYLNFDIASMIGIHNFNKGGGGVLPDF